MGFTAGVFNSSLGVGVDDSVSVTDLASSVSYVLVLVLRSVLPPDFFCCGGCSITGTLVDGYFFVVLRFDTLSVKIDCDVVGATNDDS